jgi:general secretion pathway protein D
VDSYQYISTGITVNVTPRVSGTNIFLDIQQEISDAGVAASGNPNPPISKRSASTNVMVASGDTMLLGGLYQDGNRHATAGLPFLSSIPVLGGAFGSQTMQSDRTELAMLITPRVIESVEESRAVVDEIRKGFTSIESFGASASTSQRPTRGLPSLKMSDALPAMPELNGLLQPVITSPQPTNAIIPKQ